MPIITLAAFALTCDRCPTFVLYSTLFPNETLAISTAKQLGWTATRDALLCPPCAARLPQTPKDN